MAFTYVTGSVTGTIDSVGGSSHGVTLNQTTGAGNLLIGEFLWDGGTGAVSDPSNGTWTPIGSPLAGAGSLAGFHGQFFYVPSAVAAKPVVTLTITGTASTFIAFEIVEYSYTGGTLSIDGTPSYTNATAIASLLTTGTVTTTGTSGLAVAAVFAVDSGASAVAPYTLRDDGTYNAGTGALIEDKTGINAGVQVATMTTIGATDNAMLGLVAFKTGSSNAPDDDPGFMPRIQTPNPVVSVWS